MASFPSQIVIKAWMRIDKDYDGNLDIMRATTYKKAPPQAEWKKDTYGASDGTGEGEAYPDKDARKAGGLG